MLRSLVLLDVDLGPEGCDLWVVGKRLIAAASFL